MNNHIHKKGISPLIATVLLIGFAVALAAVVMTWGLDFIRQTTENVGKETDKALQCTKLDFEISTVDCTTNKATIANNGEINISAMTFRVDQGGDITPTRQQGIGSLGVKQYDVDLSGSTNIEAIASVLGAGGDEILCKDAPEKYITNCP